MKDEEKPENVYHRAGIYAEFGKIVCISVGVVHIKSGQRHIRVKSFFGDDEKTILIGFAEMLKTYGKGKDFNLCAHNGKEFDFPFISRRMLVHGIHLPPILDVSAKKPWEVKFLDTLELWKFGDYKNYTSLELLTHIFGIASPKSDIDGSQVAKVFYEEKDFRRIADYCERDVVAIIQLLLKFTTEELIPEKNISIVE